ncbi:MAG: PadR family transcriptional regulator [Acidobacteriaceae bacterium]|nr:PadR family transcriptional regulator [Acidobacteriaceae bacterium]
MTKEESGSDRVSVLQGTLHLLVLKVLTDGPAHGHGISRRLGELSRDWLQVDEGSLYPCLYRMEKRGWIRSEVRASENNRRARYYALTSKGWEQFRVEHENWRNFNRVVEEILEGA